MMTEQHVEHFKIRSVNGRLRPWSHRPAFGASRRWEATADRSARAVGPTWMQLTKQNAAPFKIRSVSDGSAWGWGPTRTKQ